VTQTAEETRQPKRERAGFRAVLFVILGLGLLGGAAYAALYYAAGDRIPRGTSIAGVDVGGMTESEAVTALQEGLADSTGDSIPFTVDGAQGSVQPAKAGFSVDYVLSVQQAGAERSWDPAWLWDWFTGGDDLEAVVSLDQDKMNAFLDGVVADRGQEAVDGTVRFSRGRVVETAAVNGVELDRMASQAALEDAYLGDGTADLPLSTIIPDISDEDVKTAVDDFANPAVSGQVTLAFGDATVELAPEKFTRALVLRPVDGALEPAVKAKRLKKILRNQVPENGAPVDATVELVNGRPRVVPGKPGVGYDPQDVVGGLLDVVTKPVGQRRLKVKATVERPSFTTQDARALQITEQVSTFTTYYPYANYRNVNIGRAAELIDGTVLKPGDTFSLNGIVGERTVANGFTTGYVISDGIIVSDLGGGVSQIATTTFNAMFFAGLEDVEHKPHSFYIDRYPVGREATVAWGSVDLRFKNDTPYGVLVSAKVTPSTVSSSGVVTVSMYSTKYWDISTKTGNRYNFTAPEVRRIDTVSCHAAEGYGGFDIDVWRYFRRAGSSELARTEKFHTHYIPSDTVVCTNPDAEDNVS